MSNYLLITFFSALTFFGFNTTKPEGEIPATANSKFLNNPNNLEKLQVLNNLDSSGKFFIHIPHLYNQGWDTLAQAKFWRSLIRLNPDSGLVNVASSRLIIDVVNTKEWDRKTDLDKEAYRDSVRKKHKLSPEEKIFFTKGKADFYDFEGAMETIDRGIFIFEREKTDPFYAQTILLIESPGKCAKSSVGACGSFQLMKTVAIQMGMKVNSTVDERTDFDKSAQGAAKLIRTVCIPQAKEMCARLGLSYKETDLWFRLLVLHNYHAGAGNVGRALNLIENPTSDKALITTLWQTKAGAFGNASQNYSQVAIAALLELDDIIFKKYENVYFHPLAFKD
jgi:hypothetical protein